jgi:anti-sigma B factor antagonist
MAQVQITIQDIDAGGKPAKIIGFVGQLDETNVDEEAKKVYAVVDEMPQPQLILDFSGLDYMNSKSIGYVTDWYSRVMAKNGTMVIAGPKANILDILKVVGITQIVSIHDSIDAAKIALGGGGSTSSPAPSPAPATTTSASPQAPNTEATSAT